MNSSDQNNPQENNPSQSNSNRKGKGRQKVDMVKIENETNLQVTFSKRRAGLFKKASELSTLCGAESAIVVFSPGEKAHSFGNPDVETIANRFLNQNPHSRSDSTDQLFVAHSRANMRQSNQELTNVEGQLELERKRRQEYKEMRKANENQNWCPPRIDELNYQQLDELKRSLLSFKQNFENKVQNATSLTNSYVQGTNPDAGTGGSNFSWTIQSDPGTNFPFNPSFQGPNDQFALFGNKEDMYTSNAPLRIGGSSTSAFYDGGSGSSNITIPTNPMANYSPNASTFPNLVTTSAGFAGSFDPAVGNLGFTVQYPPPPPLPTTGSSNMTFPYNYGNSSDMIPYVPGTGSSNLELERRRRGKASNDQDKSQGYKGNHGRRSS